MLQRLRLDTKVIVAMPETKVLKITNDLGNFEQLLCKSARDKIEKAYGGSFPTSYALEIFDMSARRWVSLDSK